MWETQVQSLGGEDLLEKEMATHSSILAWKIPWTEEHGRLGHKESDMTSLSLSLKWSYSVFFIFYYGVLMSFPMSQLFTWDGQSTGVSASASILPMNTQDWSPLGRTGWISLQSKGLSRVFSNTTVQKHQFFGAQLSSQSNCHIHTWPLEKP